VRSELASLAKDEAEKLQLLDILRFQVGEIQSANLTAVKTLNWTKKNID